MPFEPGDPAPADSSPSQPPPSDVPTATTDVVVRPVAPPEPTWQRRVVALRASLPALARHPAVVAASAAAAAVAVRTVADVARRGVAGSTPTQVVVVVVSQVVQAVPVRRDGGSVQLPPAEPR